MLIFAIVMFTRTQRTLLIVVPPVLALVIRALSMTLRYRQINAPSTLNAHQIPGPTIFAFWHCSFLACAHHFRNLNIAIMISHSWDGELLARTVRRLGFHPVRGSSTRGGAEGLLAMREAHAQGHICAFAADGPKGPARVAKYGAVRLAEHTGAPWIGAFHAQPDRAWVLRSWDRFMIPKPFSTVTITWPAHVAPTLDNVQRAIDEAVAMVPSEAPLPELVAAT
jgi:lysophospholipid acyltransferase (LPLAT)-like uncharacterized protein